MISFLSRRVPVWMVVLTVYLSAAVALAQIAPSPVHPSSAGAATSVSAAAFPLKAPNGTAAAPSYSFSGATGTGWYRDSSSGDLAASFAGTAKFQVSQGTNIRGDEQYRWATLADIFGTADTGLARCGAGVACATLGGANDGWIQNTAGDQFLTANHTNATITPTNITDLTTSVTSGRKYTFQFVAKVDNSTDADGLRFDFEGGTAAATDFWANCEVSANNVVSSTFSVTALATDMTAATLTGVGTFRCNGSFEPSSTGTFIPRAGVNTAVSGTLTTFRGSHLLTKDMP